MSSLTSPTTTWNGFAHSNDFLAIAPRQRNDYHFEQPERPDSPTLSTPCSVVSPTSQRLTSFFVDASPTTTQLAIQAISTDWSESCVSPLSSEHQWMDTNHTGFTQMMQKNDCTFSTLQAPVEEFNFPAPPTLDTFTAGNFVMPPPPDISPPLEFPASVINQSEQQVATNNVTFKNMRIPQQLPRQQETSQPGCETQVDTVARQPRLPMTLKATGESHLPTLNQSRGSNPAVCRRPLVPQRSPSTRLSTVGQQVSPPRALSAASVFVGRPDETSHTPVGVTTADGELTPTQPFQPAIPPSKRNGSVDGNSSIEVNSLPVGDIIKKFDNIRMLKDCSSNLPSKRSQTLDRASRRSTGDSSGVASPSAASKPPISLPTKPCLKGLQSMLSTAGPRSVTPNWSTSLQQNSPGSSVGGSGMSKGHGLQLPVPANEPFDRRGPVVQDISPPPPRSLQPAFLCLNGGRSQEEGLNRISGRRDPPVNSGQVNLPSRKTSPSLNRANHRPSMSLPVESLQLDRTTLETLTQFQVADAFQIPGFQALQTGQPSWKQQRIDRRNREAAEAFAEDLRKWGRTPQWKRNLIEKRHQSINQRNLPDTGAVGTTTSCTAPTDSQREMGAVISDELTRKLQRQLERVSSAIPTV